MVYALGDWQPPFGIVLVADRLSALMVLLTALLALFGACCTPCAGSDERGRHFHALFQFQLFGLNGAFLTGDLFNLFVFFEVLLIASYALLLHGGGKARTRAGPALRGAQPGRLGAVPVRRGPALRQLGTLNMADLAVKVAAALAGGRRAGARRPAACCCSRCSGSRPRCCRCTSGCRRAYAAAHGRGGRAVRGHDQGRRYAILRVFTADLRDLDAGAVRLGWSSPRCCRLPARAAIGVLGAIASMSHWRRQVAYLVRRLDRLVLLVPVALFTHGFAGGGDSITCRTDARDGGAVPAGRQVASRRGDAADRWSARSRVPRPGRAARLVYSSLPPCRSPVCRRCPASSARLTFAAAAPGSRRAGVDAERGAGRRVCWPCDRTGPRPAVYHLLEGRASSGRGNRLAARRGRWRSRV